MTCIEWSLLFPIPLSSSWMSPNQSETLRNFHPRNSQKQTTIDRNSGATARHSRWVIHAARDIRSEHIRVVAVAGHAACTTMTTPRTCSRGIRVPSTAGCGTDYSRTKDKFALLHITDPFTAVTSSRGTPPIILFTVFMRTRTRNACIRTPVNGFSRDLCNKAFACGIPVCHEKKAKQDDNERHQRCRQKCLATW